MSYYIWLKSLKQHLNTFSLLSLHFRISRGVLSIYDDNFVSYVKTNIDVTEILWHYDFKIIDNWSVISSWILKRQYYLSYVKQDFMQYMIHI